MKIQIKNEKKEFTIKIPTWFIKTKQFQRIMLKNNTSIEKYNSKKMKSLYKVLKKYIQENGNFTLIDINSNDSSVKISL